MMTGLIKSVNHVCFSHNQQKIAFSCLDKTITVMDIGLINAKPTTIQQSHGQILTGLKFFDAGKLISSSRDRTIKIWDI